MTTWLVRPGVSSSRQELALRAGVALVGWNDLGDLSHAETRDDVRAMYVARFRETNPRRVANHVGQLWTFARRIRPDDLIVRPISSRGAIAVGRVVGSYQYRQDLGDAHHSLPVEWVAPELPRAAFDDELLRSFGVFLSVCEIRRHYADARIRRVLADAKRNVAGLAI